MNEDAYWIGSLVQKFADGSTKQCMSFKRPVSRHPTEQNFLHYCKKEAHKRGLNPLDKGYEFQIIDKPITIPNPQIKSFQKKSVHFKYEALNPNSKVGGTRKAAVPNPNIARLQQVRDSFVGGIRRLPPKPSSGGNTDRKP